MERAPKSFKSINRANGICEEKKSQLETMLNRLDTEALVEALQKMEWDLRKRALAKLPFYRFPWDKSLGERLETLDLIPLGEGAFFPNLDRAWAHVYYKMGMQRPEYLPWTPETHHRQSVRVMRGTIALLRCISDLPKPIQLRVIRDYTLADYMCGMGRSVFDLPVLPDIGLGDSDPVLAYLSGNYELTSSLLGISECCTKSMLLRDLANRGKLAVLEKFLRPEDLYFIPEAYELLFRMVKDDWRLPRYTTDTLFRRPELLQLAKQYGYFWSVNQPDWKNAWIYWTREKHANPNYYTLDFRRDADAVDAVIPHLAHLVLPKLALLHYFIHCTQSPKTRAGCAEYLKKRGLWMSSFHGRLRVKELCAVTRKEQIIENFVMY